MTSFQTNQLGAGQPPKTRIVILGGGFGGVAHRPSHGAALPAPAGHRDCFRGPGQFPRNDSAAVRLLALLFPPDVVKISLDSEEVERLRMAVDAGAPAEPGGHRTANNAANA